MSDGLWDTLAIDIVLLFPAYRKIEYIITFVDCFSKCSILIPSKDHMFLTISNALLYQIIPYFEVPRRLLSNRGQEFWGKMGEELLKALDIQRVLTSPYHPEGNAINERSYHTMNDRIFVLLYDDTLAPHWVNKIPTIMLTINSMPHQPHGYSSSMIATGWLWRTPCHQTWLWERSLSKGKITLQLM